jgi:hypothetical protein
MEELLSQHRKEIKSLDGEKRAAIKKAKSTKGKKAKDEITRYVTVPEMLCYGSARSTTHEPQIYK